MMAKLLLALALLALTSGCTMVHGAGELFGLECEWVHWRASDPTARNAARPSYAGPDDEVCYLVWADPGRVALVSKGDEASEVSCEEREDARPTAEDPLVVRRGQAAWIFGQRDEKPHSFVAPIICAELEQSSPGEIVAARLVD